MVFFSKNFGQKFYFFFLKIRFPFVLFGVDE